MKPWRCANRHVLGMAARNGSGVGVLLLFREAVEEGKTCGVLGNPEGLAETGEFEVMAVIQGYAADVRCSICGRMRTWVPGEEGLRRLLEAAGKGRK